MVYWISSKIGFCHKNSLEDNDNSSRVQSQLRFDLHLAEPSIKELLRFRFVDSKVNPPPSSDLFFSLADVFPKIWHSCKIASEKISFNGWDA
ncbi:hypothetical protein QE152_g19415 [Popillia japonica]|uniref:Uncharacterized protein n=1 Tax=Popillia japonica TaxID=7064 RepID=A0AAW1KTK7_POPJA